MARALTRKVCIIGTALTLEEMLNPVEEQEVGDSPYRFEGGDAEIIEVVRHQLAIQEGREMDVDDGSDDEDKDKPEEISTKAVIDLCQQMESLCINHGSFDSALDLSRTLRQYRGHLMQFQSSNAKQATLDSFFDAP